MTDDHDPLVAGFSGNRVVGTRHLDDLAARSVRFQSAVCASPLCTPSRMAMLTGKQAHRCAGWNNHWAIFPEHVTWPAHFGAHGYRTCLVGKMHFGGRDQMNGFQERPYGDLRHGLGHQADPISMFPGYALARSAGITEIPESLLQEVVVTRETLAWILEHQSQHTGRPWFACASYSRPHPPFTTPRRYWQRYRDRVPPPEAGTAAPAEACARAMAQRYVDLTPDEIRRGREGYYACVDFVDDCIGELLSGLDLAGALENTVVIYTSDHGEMLGNHGTWAKGLYFDRLIRVPLLISGPGVRPGAHVVPHPVCLTDLYPTACALAGLPVPPGLDGRDLSPLLAAPDEASAPHEAVFSEFYQYGQAMASLATVPDSASGAAWRVARSSRWKLVEVERGETLLFDLESDPEETTNLAGRPGHADVAAALQAALRRNFSWELARKQLVEDRQRLARFRSGRAPSTPNQYRLPDGREFDAEAGLYGVRWLKIPPGSDGGIIPQQFG